MAEAVKTSIIYVVSQADSYLLGAFTSKKDMHEMARLLGWYGQSPDCEAMVDEVPDGALFVHDFKRYKLEPK